jgi:hypothetical protein
MLRGRTAVADRVPRRGRDAVERLGERVISYIVAQDLEHAGQRMQPETLHRGRCRPVQFIRCLAEMLPPAHQLGCNHLDSRGHLGRGAATHHSRFTVGEQGLDRDHRGQRWLGLEQECCELATLRRLRIGFSLLGHVARRAGQRLGCRGEQFAEQRTGCAAQRVATPLDTIEDFGEGRKVRECRETTERLHPAQHRLHRFMPGRRGPQ